AILPCRRGGNPLYPPARPAEAGGTVQRKDPCVVCPHARAAIGEEGDARAHDGAGQGAVRKTRARSLAQGEVPDGGGCMKKLLAVSLAFACLSAAAQTYPNRAVRVVVAAQTGGPDIVARIVAAELQAQTGQPFVVENQGGANGIVGATTVAKA